MVLIFPLCLKSAFSSLSSMVIPCFLAAPIESRFPSKSGTCRTFCRVRVFSLNETSTVPVLVAFINCLLARHTSVW